MRYNNANKPRQIVARFNQTCACCGAPVIADQTKVWWTKGQRGVTCFPECPADEPPPSMDTAAYIEENYVELPPPGMEDSPPPFMADETETAEVLPF
jgi:hypothetical protein